MWAINSPSLIVIGPKGSGRVMTGGYFPNTTHLMTAPQQSSIVPNTLLYASDLSLLSNHDVRRFNRKAVNC